MNTRSIARLDGPRIAAVRRDTRAWLRRHYVGGLAWAFTLFSSARVVAYLPTIWKLIQAGDSSQYSLWTWSTFFGSNVTMALWLRERNGGRLDRASVVSLSNAAMCAATLLLIAWYRA